MNRYTPLSMEIELDITRFIKDKLTGEWNKYTYEPIKEIVLELLDSLCEVVYYPLENEDNNGFRITNMPFANGTKKDFVYINTAQTTEKQVFTAAHELGHIWGVDNYIFDHKDRYEYKLEEADRENIINRFAAILLMPKSAFSCVFDKEFDNYVEDNKITIVDLLKIIVILMKEFFAPYKAVVMRLYELCIIDEISERLLLGENGISKNTIDLVVKKIIADFGFVQFQKPTMKKWIAGFAEKLDQAEKEQAVPKNKIDKMRTTFDLLENSITSEMSKEVTIKRSEE